MLPIVGTKTTIKKTRVREVLNITFGITVKSLQIALLCQSEFEIFALYKQFIE